MSDYAYRSANGSFMDWAESLSSFEEVAALSLSTDAGFDKVYFENWYAIPKLEVFQHVKRLRLAEWHEGKLRSVLEHGGGPRRQLDPALVDSPPPSADLAASGLHQAG
jgi:hypothetical protein